MSPLEQVTPLNPPPVAAGQSTQKAGDEGTQEEIATEEEDEEENDGESEEVVSEDDDSRRRGRRRPGRRRTQSFGSVQAIEQAGGRGKARKERPGMEAEDWSGQSTAAKNRRELPPGAVPILKQWLLSEEHFAHPYPTPQDQQALMAATGIDKKQLKNWFTNARRRIWKPMLRQQHEDKANGMPTKPRTSQPKDAPLPPSQLPHAALDSYLSHNQRAHPHPPRPRPSPTSPPPALPTLNSINSIGTLSGLASMEDLLRFFKNGDLSPTSPAGGHGTPAVSTGQLQPILHPLMKTLSGRSLSNIRTTSLENFQRTDSYAFLEVFFDDDGLEGLGPEAMENIGLSMDEAGADAGALHATSQPVSGMSGIEGEGLPYVNRVEREERWSKGEISSDLMTTLSGRGGGGGGISTRELSRERLIPLDGGLKRALGSCGNTTTLPALKRVTNAPAAGLSDYGETEDVSPCRESSGMIRVPGSTEDEYVSDTAEGADAAENGSHARPGNGPNMRPQGLVHVYPPHHTSHLHPPQSTPTNLSHSARDTSTAKGSIPSYPTLSQQAESQAASHPSPATHLLHPPYSLPQHTFRSDHVPAAHTGPQLEADPQPQASDLSTLHVDSSATCPFCSELGVDTMLRPCSHLFHGTCLKPWLQSAALDTPVGCPVCPGVISSYVLVVPCMASSSSTALAPIEQ